MDWVARMIVRAEAWKKFGKAVESEPESFGLDVVNRLLLAREISPDESELLYQDREVLVGKLEALFNEFDVILLPTMPNPPSRIGQGDPLISTEQNLAYTYLWGLAGLPAISIPCGFDDGNLPIGAQIVSKPGHDLLICKLAEVFQQHTNWHLFSPGNVAFQDTRNENDSRNERGVSGRREKE
jgi:Asp-tRNA(Asn)/Glu-tRNA(Gln) amidotransferase A subunit family amidase